MTFWTMLMIKDHNGDAKAVAEAHTKRRAIDEAAETIKGFKYGECMVSTNEPGLVCVLCGWEDEAAYKEWLDSPVRAKQTTDLATVISADVNTLSFESFHVVPGPK